MPFRTKEHHANLPASSTSSEVLMSAPLQIGLLVFPRVTQLDFTGPLQVFSSLRGATAGIDFALKLVSLLVDRTTAEAIQLRLEYNPAPPFNAGSPDTAPAEVLALMKERIAPSQARRLDAARRAAERVN